MGSLTGKVALVAGASCGIGKGVAVVVDHRDDDEVAALFDQIHRPIGGPIAEAAHGR
jgi:NAD(P)-dependent dehydrogenase (short-subunit alcohol dehydrogenase family)